MATRSALSRTAVPAEVEPQYDDFFEHPEPDAERPDATEGRSSVRVLPEREEDDPDTLVALKSRIARTNLEPRNEVQERYDALTVNRYDQQICEAQGLFILLKVRLARAGVPFDQYETCIERPQRIPGERLFMGERSFGALAVEYTALKKRLAAERTMYEAACKRLSLSVYETSSVRGKGKHVKMEVQASPFGEVQQALASVYESVVAKRDNVTFEDAIALHEMVVRALRGLVLPQNETDIPAQDRQTLVSARYFCKKIEARLDQIRVKELRAVEKLAVEACLVTTAGNERQADSKTTKLSLELARIAPLFQLDSASELPRMLELRAQYHLKHAELKELRNWIESRRISDTGKVKQRIDELVPLVRRLHSAAYPQGPCLSNAPLKAYAN